jgi:hypothetical protein
MSGDETSAGDRRYETRRMSGQQAGARLVGFLCQAPTGWAYYAKPPLYFNENQPAGVNRRRAVFRSSLLGSLLLYCFRAAHLFHELAVLFFEEDGQTFAFEHVQAPEDFGQRQLVL